MSLNANESKNVGGSGMKAPLLEPDGYPGRIVIIAELGLQKQNPFEGKAKEPAYEIMVTYELADEFMVDEEGKVLKDKPRWFTENFALYPLKADKARSTKRYNGIDPTGAAKGNWAKLITAPVNVVIGNKPGTGKRVGTTVEKIESVLALPAKKAAALPPLVNEPIVFDLDNPDKDAFLKLPVWVQERIISNLEYPASKLEKLLGKGFKPERKGMEEAKPVAKEAPADVGADDEDDQPY